MKKSARIAGWEIMQNLRNKQFIIGVFLTPLLILLFGGLPTLLGQISEPPVRTFYYAVESEELERHFNTAAADLNERFSFNRYQGPAGEIRSEAETAGADGYFVLDEEFTGGGSVDLYTFDTPLETFAPLERVFSETLQQYRIERHGVERELVQELTAGARINPVSLDEGAGSMDFRLISALIFGGGVFFLILTSGTMLMQSALKEKKEKMTEIILSSTSAKSLMAGKMVGHLMLGMIQIGVWFGIGLPLADYFFDFPVLEAFFNPALPLFILFGLLGYLLFAAVYIGVGATMEDLQSATNAQSMVFMLPVLPVIIAGPVFSNPTGVLARGATFFPLTAPIIAIARIALGAIATWEIILSAAILILTSILLTALAARIFRVGMLMYGKSASPREVLRWLRY